MSEFDIPKYRPGFEEILGNVGGASQFQFLVFCLMTMSKMFPSMMSLIPVFAAYQQDYTCKFNGSEESIPGNGTVMLGKCHVYRNDTPQLRVPCNQWQFVSPIFPETIRSQYGLFCGWDFLAELSTTLFFIGFVFGSACYGWVSDRIGRLPAILISGTHLSIFCAASAVSPRYWLYATFRFIAGIANGGLLATSFTMMSEVTDIDHRFLICIMVHNGFSYGVCVLALIAYYVRDPMWMQLIVAILIMTVWIFPLLIPESPRWLYTTGRWKRAEKALDYVARVNRRQFSKEMRDNAFGGRSKELVKSKSFENEDKIKSVSIVHVFRKGRLAITTVINWFAWFSVSMGFFASIYTLGNLGGSIFLNVIYNSIIELPARIFAFFIAKYWGRLSVVSICLIIGAVGCFINSILIVLPDMQTGLQILSVNNKFWLVAAFDTIWTYSGELYPTVVRNVGVGLGSMWARIAATLSPQVPLLYTIWPPLPLIVMGVLPLTAGLCSLLHPETLNKPLMETVEDMNRLVTNHSRLGKLLKRRVPVLEVDDDGDENTALRGKENSNI